MRTKLAFKNTIASLVLEIVTALSGIIVPRFFTTVYGSSVNGLVSSIGQFITYMGLVEAGVSAAGIVELYKPIAEGDTQTINGIVSAVKKFYYKSGSLFLILDILLIIFYPFIVHNEITDLAFIRWMIVVLSFSGIVDYFVLGKYRVLLTADQRSYVISLFQIIGTVITMIVSIILIEHNVNAVLVKGVVSVVYVFRTIGIVIYSKIKYSFLDFNVKPLKNVFKQKNSALFHQVVGMVCNNTDIVLLTLLLKTNALVEVSVYSVYNYVGSALTSLFNAISTGVRASFGQVIAEKKTDILKESYDMYEYVYFILLFIAYTCMGTLLYSFISIYSIDFKDRFLYPRWSLVIVFTLCGLIQNIRVPGSTIQVAAGHFKQTQAAAGIEAALNIIVSIVLIFKFGIIGVLIGTCVSYAFRTTYILIYHDHVFLPGTLKKTLLRILRNFICLLGIVFFYLEVLHPNVNGWGQWLLCACIMAVISSLFFIFVNALFEPERFRSLIALMKDSYHKYE